MGKPWKIHRKKSMDSLENHEARAKFHGFHGDISMPAWDKKIVRIFPMKAYEAWDIKPWKTVGSIGIYKNKSMGSIVFSSILLISMVKHGIYANEFIPLWFPDSS